MARGATGIVRIGVVPTAIVQNSSVINQGNSEGAVPAFETSLRARSLIKDGSRTQVGKVGGRDDGIEK